MGKNEHVLNLMGDANSIKLEGRECLYEFPFPELAKNYNGIGPDWMPDWMRAAATKWGWLFEPAALIHDTRYKKGGTFKDFTAANEEFRRNCYKLAKAQYSAWDPRRYIWLNRARRWANWCQFLGWSGYRKVAEK